MTDDRDVIRFWKNVLSRAVDGSASGGGPEVPVGERAESVGQSSHLLEWFHYLAGTDHEGSGLFQSARRQRSLTTVRNRILRRFIRDWDNRSHERPHAWLKGAVFLRDGIYPAGTRRMSDVDLLVRREDLSHWDDVLRQVGMEGYRDPDWIRNDRVHKSVSSAVYYGTFDGERIMVDLHWHLIDFPARRACGKWSFSMEPVWSRVEDHAMAPEHRLLYLVDHAFTHNFFQWKWLIDVSRLSGESMDPRFVRKEAERMGMTEIFPLGRCVAGRLLTETSVPRILELLGKETGEGTGYLERVVNRNTGKGDYLKVCLEQLEGPWAKLSFLLSILFAPVTAIPSVSGSPSGFEWVDVYAHRIRRVLSHGKRILWPS